MSENFAAAAALQDTRNATAVASRRRWWVLAVVGIAQLMVVLDSTIVNVALPSAQAALGFSTADRQWVVTAYALAFGGLLLLGARLSDIFGCERMFVAGLAGFAVSSAVGGAASGFAVLVVARTVQGAFGAVLAPTALSLLSATFSEPPERGKAFGIFAAIAGGGGAAGLLLGGVLTEYLSWRWCLYVNVVFACAAVAGALISVRNQARSAAARLDVPGSVLAVGGLVCLVYGFSQASGAGWTGLSTVTLLVVGVTLLIVFAGVERRTRQPLVPLRVFADRTRAAAYLGITFAGAAIFGVLLIMTYYLQGVLRFSPLKTGLGFLPFALAAVVASTAASNVALRRFGPKVVVPAGMALGAAGAGWLSRIGLHTSYLTGIAPALVLIGLAGGTVVVSSLDLGVAGADAADAGAASGLVNSSLQIGGSIGAAVLNTLAVGAAASYLSIHRTAPQALKAASLHGDRAALTALPIVFLVGGMVTAVVYRPSKAAVREA